MDGFNRKPVNRPNNLNVPPRASSAAPSAPVVPVVPIDASPVVAPEQPPAPQSAELPVIEAPESTPPKKSSSKKKLIIWICSAVIGALLLVIAGIFVWYQIQLTPVDSNATNKVMVEIESGTSPAGIASTLKENNLIRNEDAFLWYTRLNGTQNFLQAGTYRLSASESTPEIVDHLKNGNVDTFTIRFLPGATLADNRKVFIEAGYTEAEVDAGLNAEYDSPLFAGKPESADLEGYIYGNTYKFGAGASVSEVLEHVFEVFYGVVQENDLEAKYQAQGFTLYEGITLASIVQRESGGDDKAQIAQVFYSRLAIGMPLGSDVTYQYIADKLGVERDTNLDSPYNTRRYAGLPPGPIATPGEGALIAVANPAEGDYLYFLSGDDDVTYFGRTLQEHEANIENHCQVKCQII